MAGRTVKRLFDLEIDEISLVDRSANQHADVAIAKRDEGTMTLMDVDGYEVAESELQPGDVVYDADSGEQLVACEEGASPEDYFSDDDQDDDEEPVGKAADQVAFKFSRMGRAKIQGVRAANAARNAKFGYGLGREGEAAEGGSRAIQAGMHVGRNRNRYIKGGALTTATAGGFAVGKSLGEEVYEELSKALGSDERDQVISKAMELARNEADTARQDAAEAWEIAKGLQDQAELDEYCEIAKGYNLPGDPYDIAVILKSAADTMPLEHVQYLDRLFTAAGENIYDEIGSGLGQQNSSVMGQIEAMASSAVGKSDLSEPEAIVELFATNPDAYEAYLAETR